MLLDKNKLKASKHFQIQKKNQCPARDACGKLTVRCTHFLA